MLPAIVPHPAGKAINRDVPATHVIVSLAAKAGVEWRDWQAFRHGLATNLQGLGVAG
jgi:hypothetical protein